MPNDSSIFLIDSEKLPLFVFCECLIFIYADSGQTWLSLLFLPVIVQVYPAPFLIARRISSFQDWVAP